MRFGKRWWWFAAGAVALVLLLRLTLLRPRPIDVEAMRVSRGTVEDAVTNSQAGTVKSRHRARLGAERAGRVVSIPHREGAAVQRGELLLLLDTSTAQTQLDLAKRDLDTQRAALEAARAAATLARQEFERTERLRQQGVVSQEQMDQAKSRLDGASAELRGAEARVARAGAAVRLAQDDLDHLRVAAPFDGVVAQRLVEVGESVVPGQPVLEITSPDHLYVSAAIDEIDIGRIREKLPARVTLDPYPGLVWQGAVTRVFPVVDDRKEQNRTLEVEVELAPAAGRPRPKPGTSADVEIILDQRENVMRVPTFSVIEGKRVLIVSAGKAVARDVETGLKNWEWTEIRGGLKEGEVVITNLDKQGVRPGVHVTAKEREAGAPAAGAARAAGAGS